MKTAQRYPKLTKRIHYRDLADRARRADGANDREIPEQDHLDLLKSFEPHVGVLFRLAVVAFVLAVVAVVVTR